MRNIVWGQMEVARGPADWACKNVLSNLGDKAPAFPVTISSCSRLGQPQTASAWEVFRCPYAVREGTHPVGWPAKSWTFACHRLHALRGLEMPSVWSESGRAGPMV